MAEDTQVNTDTTVEVEGEANVKSDALTLEQLNENLGTKYPDMEKAMAGMKETKNYVGKAGVVEKENEVLKEALKDKPPEGGYVTTEQYEQDMFYSKNDDLAPYKDIINARANELKLTPAEAVESDESLKGTLEKLRGFDKTEGAKSVLMSNQRLGDVSDKMEKATEAQKSGDQRGAESNAVGAVMETFKS